MCKNTTSCKCALGGTSGQTFSNTIRDGVDDFWERLQKPYALKDLSNLHGNGSITDKAMSHLDQQSVQAGIEQLLTLNGWVAALCPNLPRPFGQSDNVYDELHGHPLCGPLPSRPACCHRPDGPSNRDAVQAGIEQLLTLNGWVAALCPNLPRPFGQSDNVYDELMARRIGTQYIFVFMLDYDSSDSTETLLDLCVAVLTLIGVPFRICNVPPMTEDPAAAYYPFEEAHTRNLVLEPLDELYQKRKVKFHRVIWLKGFTCPNDIFETIVVSQANDATMVFCYESGTHVIDPVQTYYTGLRYHAGAQVANFSMTDAAPNVPCLDSSQAYFCRDLWLSAAREGVRVVEECAGAASNAAAGGRGKAHEAAVAAGADARRRHAKRAEEAAEEVAEGKEANCAEEDEQAKRVEEGECGRHTDEGGHTRCQWPHGDSDVNVGSDFDTMLDTGEGEADDAAGEDNVLADAFSIPNGVFRAARTLVNPRCMTAYAEVSHAQLTLDLFGPDKDEEDGPGSREKYVLDDWDGAPENFVCQEQRYTGGRKAPKTQRQMSFSVHTELDHSESEAEDGS
ncbi:glycosyltransferase family 69 protein [Phellopilus nigrolimitatus]|nr:glycosyltransferase family 69 protein [Phellopilus nigrolimitatus]